jgi:hypothetical protein
MRSRVAKGVVISLLAAGLGASGGGARGGTMASLELLPDLDQQVPFGLTGVAPADVAPRAGRAIR